MMMSDGIDASRSNGVVMSCNNSALKSTGCPVKRKTAEELRIVNIDRPSFLNTGDKTNITLSKGCEDDLTFQFANNPKFETGGGFWTKHGDFCRQSGSHSCFTVATPDVQMYFESPEILRGYVRVKSANGSSQPRHITFISKEALELRDYMGQKLFQSA